MDLEKQSRIDLTVNVPPPPVLGCPEVLEAGKWTVCGRHQLHVVEAAKNQPVEIRLVAMRVQNIDLPFAQEDQQPAQATDIKLEALVNREERLDPPLSSPLAQIEFGVRGSLR